MPEGATIGQGKFNNCSLALRDYEKGETVHECTFLYVPHIVDKFKFRSGGK